MGYFSNGTEEMMYREKYCDRCVHDKNQDCPVLLLHLLHNYEEANKPESMLHVLIPLRDDPYDSNGQCKMFIEDEQAADPRQEKLPL